MGEKQTKPFQLSFNGLLKVDFQGSHVTSDGGLILVRELDDGWSKFDYVGPVGGPWVSPRKFQLVERFKFFSKIAWDRGTGWQRLFQPGAKWRCEADFYRFPVEQLLEEPGG